MSSIIITNKNIDDQISVFSNICITYIFSLFLLFFFLVHNIFINVNLNEKKIKYY